MGHMLKQMGYTNIKILEKSDRIGGKSRTVFIDDLPHELGTCFLHSQYNQIMKLIKEYMNEEDIVQPGSMS